MKNSDFKKYDFVYPLISLILILIIWDLAIIIFDIKSYIVPSPKDIIKEFFYDFNVLWFHTKITLIETIIGFIISIIFAFFVGSMMDFIPLLKKCFYPLVYISQMIPTITIAPLLIIWFGFGIKSKIICVILTCFFPILINFMDGLSHIDEDYLNLFKILNANKFQTFLHLKLPLALNKFFIGLNISSTYAFIAAVVAEWLGGEAGLGVYMVRAKSSYSLDKVFACNLIIVFFSLLFVKIIDYLRKIFFKNY